MEFRYIVDAIKRAAHEKEANPHKENINKVKETFNEEFAPEQNLIDIDEKNNNLKK